MANQQSNSGNPSVDYEYRRRKNKEDMRMQLTAFMLMIFLTLIAFIAVAGDFDKYFVLPFILLLAVVQLVFQLYYFMHMSHKGHEAPALFLYSGALVAFITILAFLTIVWI
ncbi:cytochrome c oxidase subunit IVB [Rossellomorea marisflavi]|uniref:Cytochrome B6 n=1 Tax=Rossellomorea marisflavi TaxID=189381 RepID=A0A0J5SHA2_9BACI|nr:cytochrome c oxidase subunit IVB [Rossellomorea marisflavi]KMK96635.1 cytochrome B6 [Rossellomorea marisflavi]KML06325.1 cytochrome B6 [Rossellomorea marisflavi]KML32712.1 cytochrome B6 [Rossellomorea marisflavi]KZE49692.1 cytochrome B6 [Rossellomorea marisflavi]MCM2603615.1 cytochrome c oxidase subunit IVB [Rossellomorea marisflavi]